MPSSTKSTKNGRDAAASHKPLTEQTSTLADVARLAGVSASTVSRILNGQVESGSREAVEAAIKKLRFKPNLVAKSLRSGVSMAVGVLSQDLESPYHSRAAKGVEDELQGSGYTPIVIPGHWNRDEEEAERVRMLMSRKVDGIVILGGRLRDEQLIELADRQPIVIVGRNCTGPNLRSFNFDQVRGGYLATKHLISIGHRRIAHIAGLQYQPDAIGRMQGYMDAHREEGLPVDQRLIVSGDFEEQGGLLAMDKLLDSGLKFSAVFAANDQTLCGARLALFRRRIRVPEDMSLVGFDGMPQSLYAIPPITTVRQPIYEVGCAAARALLGMLGVQTQTAPIGSLELELVIRETTAPV